MNGFILAREVPKKQTFYSKQKINHFEMVPKAGMINLLNREAGNY
ncbi:hypothetical protein N692_15115 [Lactiplantibacillus plantarum EGD-AQ4]|nr:hypothetical protein N692_15115 [Lactiplantibacillus plantarum EGD-AQ4]